MFAATSGPKLILGGLHLNINDVREEVGSQLQKRRQGFYDWQPRELSIQPITVALPGVTEKDIESLWFAISGTNLLYGFQMDAASHTHTD